MKKKELHAIRGIDEETYMKFREKALAERMKVGEALTLAMREWIKKGREGKGINPRNLLKIKPFDWGPGTEKTSKEIDEILYGKKR
ncbi:MAG: hypothetical protein QMD36_05125 [Candidatus Aenigmarchaeota archaeon]|nr:hypothetical protein [Candidatus Aenigmarchaeota archaeon]